MAFDILANYFILFCTLEVDEIMLYLLFNTYIVFTQPREKSSVELLCTSEKLALSSIYGHTFFK
jgi:hypothetical protein